MRHSRFFLIVVVAFILGCSNNDEPTVQGIVQAIADDPGIPEGWDQISISHEQIGDSHNFVLKGKNQSLQSAINQVKERIAKPIEFAEGLNADEKVPELDITLKAGTWNELLGLIADKYGCELKETENAFTLHKIQ